MANNDVRKLSFLINGAEKNINELKELLEKHPEDKIVIEDAIRYVGFFKSSMEQQREYLKIHLN